MNLIPLNDKIILEPIEESKETSFGFQIVKKTEERPMTGKVIAVGPLISNPKEDDPAAKSTAEHIKTGVKIAFTKYAPTEFEHEGTKYLIISLKDVLAVIKN
jgi:chaperonin GroES